MNFAQRAFGHVGLAIGAATLLAVCGTVLAGGPAANQPQAQAHNESHDHGLPFFDIRRGEDEAPTAIVRKSLADARSNPASKGRDAAIRRLQRSVAGAAVDDHDLLGTPHFVRSTSAFLTDARPGVAPARIVGDFIADYRELFEIDAIEIEKAAVRRDFVTQHNGVTHLTLQQQLGGVDIFDCIIRTNVMPDGRLINVSSTFLPRPAGDFAVKAPALSDLEAIRLAAANAGITVTTDPAPQGDAEGPMMKRSWTGSPDFRSEEPVVTKLVYFPLTRDELRPAWHVVVPQRGVGHTYDIIVDAVDGRVLWRHNWLVFETTEPATYRVYTSDSPAPMSPGRPTPDGVQAPFVARDLVTVMPAQIAPFSPNGWIPDGQTETLGNNVDAHLDLDGSPNQPDLPRPTGGATRVFDFPQDNGQAPTSYQNAAVTQLFYLSNLYHDRLYAMGFNEAAGNFQQDNFGLGGAANDRVQADCQDASGTNNANFSTNVDGSSARCQMYIFTGTTPDRDGSLDADIVYHELTHGTSIRLHEATLTGTQARSMGEGWSDFFGLCLLAEPTDDPNANYCTGGYATYLLSATFVDNYYFGIRRFPYSTNLNIAPQTYADIDPGQQFYDASIPRSTVIGNSAAEVHNAGEIWCLALWECRERLIAAHGFAGNQLVMQLVVDGMKIAPSNPSMLQERDAILQADLVNNNRANATPLWVGFAKRGMGASATSPTGGTTAGIVEAFDVPFNAIFTYPDGVPTLLEPGTAQNFRVNVEGQNLTVTPGSGTLHYSVNGGAFNPAPMTQGSPNEYTATLPGFGCLDSVEFYVSVNTSEGSRSDPATAPDATYAADVFTGVTLADHTFEVDSGWTVGPNSTPTPPLVLSGVWTRGDPNSTAAQPGDDTADAGASCWFTGQAAVGAAIGANDIDNGFTTLVSPTFDVSAYTDAVVSYYRWYSNGLGSGAFTDVMRIEVSTDGGSSWLPYDNIGPGNATDPNVNPGWRFVTKRLTEAGVALTSGLRLRFQAEDVGTAGIVEAALDQFRVTGALCDDGCGSADFNGDGDTGTDADIEAFFACLGGTCCATCGNADFDGDGDTGTDADIEAFFRVLAGGTC